MINKAITSLKVVESERHAQLQKETPGTYNDGYVAGELSGVTKSIQVVQEIVEQENPYPVSVGIIDSIKAAKSRDELQQHLKQCKNDFRHAALTRAIEDLNDEIEHDIIINKIDEALYAMAQVVMLEDQLLIEERFLAKKAVVLA